MKYIFKKFIETIRPYLKLQFIGIFAAFIYTLAAIVNPIISKYIIDDVITSDSYKKLYFGLGFLLAFSLIQPITGYIKEFLFYKISEKISFDIRKKMFEKIVRTKMSFFDKNKEGDIVSRIVNDGNEVSGFLTKFISNFIDAVFTFSVSLIGMLYFSFKITFFIFFTVFIFVVIVAFFSIKLKELSLKARHNADEITSFLSNTIDGIITVKSFSAEKTFLDNYKKILDKNYLTNMKINSLVLSTQNIMQIAFIAATCVIFGMGGYEIIKGRMTLGGLVALWSYFPMFIESATGFSLVNLGIQKTTPIFHRIEEYTNLETEKLDFSQEKMEKEITINDLSFEYENKKIFQNINLKFEKNSLNAIVGHSGSGKTSFFKILLKFYEPSAGTIYYGKKEIKETDIYSVRKGISFVSQNIDLFNISIKENLLYANSAVDDNSIEEICKKLKIHEKIKSLPDGYDTIIDEQVNLSGGEKQRLGIARAILKDSDIIIFDEPTSALDPENEKIIKNILEEEKNYKTVLVISHRDTTIENADTVFVFGK